MKQHLLAIEKGHGHGRRLGPGELADVVKSIKALSAGKSKAGPRPDLKGQTIGQMLEEAASRHPEIAKAVALMGGG